MMLIALEAAHLLEGRLVSHDQVIVSDEDIEGALFQVVPLQLLALLGAAIIHHCGNVWCPLHKLIAPVGQDSLRHQE